MDVSCRTNLDDYQKEKWPNKMCCRPMVGDRVSSESGKRLDIVSITHVYDKYDGSSSLEIELGQKHY